jgi:hypothetical protein
MRDTLMSQSGSRRTVATCALALAFVAAGPRQTFGQQPPSATPPKPAAAKSAIPTPESVFGFSVGADSQLIDYEQSIAYFRKLAAASNHIKLINVGTTSFGRPWTAAIISSPENLAKLDHYREINMRIAHPSGLTDSSARRLAHEGKVFVDISGGLHASEIAGSQHTPQLAYEILSKPNDPVMKEIFDNVIFFLWPTINPDGQDIVVKNCRENYEHKNPGPMEPYEKYMGHDNNRDSYMMNGIESRIRQRVWREWEPDIIYVHHQSSPEPTRIWIPPFADPPGLRTPPIMAREINTIGMLIAQELDAHEQPGAAHMLATYDAWYPGYIDYMPVYQNIPSWWTETQGGNCATPKAATSPDNFSAEYRDLRPTPLYLSPWTGGRWGLRDAVNVMVTASIATLRYGAKFREDVLYNRYQSARDVVKKYSTAGPFAYIVPQDQHDPVAPVELLRRFAFHGIRISQLDRDAAYNGTTYPKGTWVIPMDQEFATLVQEVFEVQHYPDLPQARAYDAAGWTLPFQMGVNVVEGKTPLSADFRAALKPVPPGKALDWHTVADEPLTINANAAGIVPRPGKITGTGDQVLLDPAQNNSFVLMHRALAEGGRVSYLPGSAGRGPRYILSGVAPAKVDSWASELWVTAERTSGASGLATSGSPPRIGLGNDGWTEWLFDTHGVKYTKVSATDFEAGNLASRFDVLVLPGGIGGRGGRGGGGGGGGGRGRGGAPPATGPDPATTAVDAFVRGGGTVISWANGVNSAINALQLPVRDLMTGLTREQYFTGSASVMEVTTDPTHQIMAGMPERADVNVSNPPALTTLDGFEGTVLAKYPSDHTPLRSGWLTAGAEKYMEGFAAALDVKHGSGHVVLVAFNPIWRGQPTGSFRIIFNSLLYGRDAAAQAKGVPGFWTAPPMPTMPPPDSAGRGGRGGRGGGRGGRGGADSTGAGRRGGPPPPPPSR